MKEPSSKNPYLIRMYHEWMSDNGMLPHISINMLCENILAPTEYTKDDILVLNIGHSAVTQLIMNNDTIIFYARFGGIEQFVQIPVHAILTMFDPASATGIEFTSMKVDEVIKPVADVPKRQKPTLRIV